MVSKKRISSLAVLVTIHLLASCCASAKAADQLTLGAGRPGSKSHQLGVGLTSLVKIIVLPHDGIDLELANPNSTLDDKHLLIDRQAVLQTLLTGQLADAFRSVMAFRSHDTADESQLELMARTDVSASIIYDITKAIFENGLFLNTVSERVWDISIDQSVRGLQLPLHPGTLRYYQATGGLEQQVADGPPSDASISPADQVGAGFYGASTFFVYFDGSHARLHREAQDQIAAACRNAVRSGTPVIQISWYSGAPKSDLAESLAGERIQSVMAALSQEVQCGPDMSLVALDEGKETLPTELLDTGDDRVEVTIMLPHGEP